MLWILRISLILVISSDREAPACLPLFAPTCDVAPRLLAPPHSNDVASKPQNDEVKLELENSSLWKQFSSVGTEMIITKKGRLEQLEPWSSSNHNKPQTQPSFLSCTSQKDVSRLEAEAVGFKSISPLHTPPWRRSSGQLPLPFPKRRLAGRRQRWGEATRPGVHPPWLTRHRSTLAEPQRLLPLRQAHQQHTGHAGACECCRFTAFVSCLSLWVILIIFFWCVCYSSRSSCTRCIATSPEFMWLKPEM